MFILWPLVESESKIFQIIIVFACSKENLDFIGFMSVTGNFSMQQFSQFYFKNQFMCHNPIAAICQLICINLSHYQVKTSSNCKWWKFYKIRWNVPMVDKISFGLQRFAPLFSHASLALMCHRSSLLYLHVAICVGLATNNNYNTVAQFFVSSTKMSLFSWLEVIGRFINIVVSLFCRDVGCERRIIHLFYSTCKCTCLYPN